MSFKCARFAIYFIAWLGIICSIDAEPIGWYEPIVVERDIEEFGVCCHEPTNGLYAVTAHLQKPFQKGAPTVVDLALHSLVGGKFEKQKLLEIHLAPSETLFPIYPSISVLNSEILIAWQETNPQGNATGIYYLYSSTGIGGFGEKRILNFSEGQLNTILPMAKLIAPGKIGLIYQQIVASNRFSLFLARGSEGAFNQAEVIAGVSGGTRGNLFPSVLRIGNRLEVFYQNRDEQTLKDDIFRSVSLDGGAVWSPAARMTQNGLQNFAPKISANSKNLSWVWQANPEKIFSVFYQSETSQAVKILESGAAAYFPTLANSDNSQVIAWIDTRLAKPHIFARFLDRPENVYVGVDHQISNREGASMRPLEFIRWGNHYFLSYACHGSVKGGGIALCMRQVDTHADQIQLASKINVMRKGAEAGDVVFSWPKPNEVSGIESYAYVVDDLEDTIPDLYNLNARTNQITLPGLNGGKYYMHVRYRDRAGNESPVNHYAFVIDTSAPSRPLITSPTHENGIPNTNANAIIKFNSADDSGIKLYRYAFGQKIPRVFTETTTTNELALDNIPPGKYTFAVEAIDLGGNVSERGFFRLEIGKNEGGDLTIKHNAEADVIARPEIIFTIIDNSNLGIKQIFQTSGFQIKDPFSGTTGEFTKQENIYTLHIKHLQRGTSVISLGIIYENGAKAAPRHFYFESNDPRAKDPFALTDVGYEKLQPQKLRDAFDVGGKSDIIRHKFDRGILELRFAFESKHPVRVQGYTYELAHAERLVTGEINSTGRAEYIYFTKPGNYFINVRTHFAGPEKNQFAYDSVKFSVPDLRAHFRKVIFLSLAAGFICCLVIILWQRKRIRYYWSAIRER